MFVGPTGDPSAALIFGTAGLDRTRSTRTRGIVACCAPLFLGLKAKGEFFPVWAPIAIPFFIIAKVIFGESALMLIAGRVRLRDRGLDLRLVTLLDLLTIIEAFVGDCLQLLHLQQLFCLFGHWC